MARKKHDWRCRQSDKCARTGIVGGKSKDDRLCVKSKGGKTEIGGQND